MGRKRRALKRETTYKYSGEPVGEDPTLEAHEKETVIGFSKVDDHIRIDTSESAIIRWLLSHPQFELSSANLLDGKVVSLSGTLPIGCLKLSGKARSSTKHSACLGVLPQKER